MHHRSFLMIPAFLFLSACNPGPGHEKGSGSNHHAGGFTITRIGCIKKLTVRNPWENARNIELEYFLVNKESLAPDSLSGKNTIRIPVDRIICLSTSHLSFLELLGELDKVTGVSGSHYISNTFIRQRISEGLTTDVGYGQNLNYEEIIRQKPDMVMAYGVDSEITGFLGKLHDLGIPVVLNAEYLEETPLGKAEWIRFVSAFFNKEAEADSIFSKTEQDYLEMAEKVSGVPYRPDVMVGLPYREVWWVPGGKSYMAKLIADAGGNYIAGNNDSHESFVISMEQAITLTSGTGIWINTGMAVRKTDITASDPRFGNLILFKHARIYNNNKRCTPDGGNDFWESGTMHPDLILADLIRIFHPGILPDGPFNYYREIR